MRGRSSIIKNSRAGDLQTDTSLEADVVAVKTSNGDGDRRLAATAGRVGDVGTNHHRALVELAMVSS